MENKMKSISALALSIALGGILFVTGTVNAQDEPAKEITVPGDTGMKWINTGITVVSGDTIRLDAKGEVDVGGSWGVHGPEGTTNFSEQPPGYYPLETKMRYGVAARITLGSGQKYKVTQSWVYGEQKEMKVTRSGMLWLTVNDDAPEGNEGEFKVTVTIIKNTIIKKKQK